MLSVSVVKNDRLVGVLVFATFKNNNKASVKSMFIKKLQIINRIILVVQDAL